MKTKLKFFLSLLLLFSINLSAQEKIKEFPKLTGPYLGQTPPGTTAELFAPGVLSTIAHEHSSPAFSPDGKEVYYSVFYPGVPIEVIMFRRFERGEWSEPEVAPFSGRCRDGQPAFSNDGLKMYFCSTRPRENEAKANRMTLWCVEKKQDSWGKPYCLEANVNSGNMEMTLSVAENGNVYFSANDSIKGWTLYKIGFKDGMYTSPQCCGKLVGEDYAEWCPYIAPDERYMLFSAYAMKGEENNDIYIAFKDKHGNWSKAINIGLTVNTAYQEQFPRVSNDGKYLFFTSNRLKIDRPINHSYEYSEPLTYKRIKDMMNEPGNGKGDIYWVDAEFINELKPKGLK